MKLGRLETVDIRKVWPHEQYDFSKWLAAEENIRELGDTLNLSLTDVETEKFVGNYRCDILCKDEITGKMVLIENQLEPTNHDHLGKIITYASGLDAAVIVWIVASARDEHASAIEWLNKHTDDEISFFLLEVHAYKIGNSDPAPQFTIIEQPNDFVKTVKTIAKSNDLNESQKGQGGAVYASYGNSFYEWHAVVRQSIFEDNEATTGNSLFLELVTGDVSYNVFLDDYNSVYTYSNNAPIDNNWWGVNDPNWSSLLSGTIKKPNTYAVVNVSANPSEISPDSTSKLTY